jgi:hypothetical protein
MSARHTITIAAARASFRHPPLRRRLSKVSPAQRNARRDPLHMLFQLYFLLKIKNLLGLRREFRSTIFPN